MVEIPEYPRIRHITTSSNATRDDLILTDDEVRELVGQDIVVQEKLDGANVGITIAKGQLVMRNRNHYISEHTKTIGSFQFNGLWNWVYDRYDQVCQLCQDGKYAFFGEWLFCRHTIAYRRLPGYLVAFDVYDYSVDRFLSPDKSAEILKKHGIPTAPILMAQVFESVDDILSLVRESTFGDEQMEGVIIRTFNKQYLKQIFKYVRKGFIPGQHWTSYARDVNGVANES